MKKKLSTYRTESGYVKNVSDELLIEILLAWESWTGPSSGFCGAIGVHAKRMASLIGRAKKLKRDGLIPEDSFKEIKVAESSSNLMSLTSGPCSGVEILWDNGKLIRFQ